MESTFFRGIVLLLALTSFGASRSTSTTGSKSGVHAQVQTDPTAPMPVCPPNDPNACGID